MLELLVSALIVGALLWRGRAKRRRRRVPTSPYPQSAVSYLHGPPIPLAPKEMPRDRTTSAPTAPSLSLDEYRDWLRRFKPEKYRVITNGIDYWLQYHDDGACRWKCVNELPRNPFAWKYGRDWEDVAIEVVPGTVVEFAITTDEKVVKDSYGEIMEALDRWQATLKVVDCDAEAKGRGRGEPLLFCAFCHSAYPKTSTAVKCSSCGAPLRG